MVTASGTTTSTEPAVDDDAGGSPRTGDNRMLSGEGHGDCAYEGIMPAGSEARTVEFVAVHAEVMENAVGSCDKGAKSVNGEQHTAVDEEIAGNETDEFQIGEEETVGCRMGERDVAQADAETFHRLGGWLKHIDFNGGKNACKVLVGCKNDLTAKKVVDYDTAKAFADKCGLQLFETSAVDGTNVDEAFMTIATDIMRRFVSSTGRTGPTSDSVTYHGDQPAKKTSWFSRLFNKS
ncbi:hypothetical protein MTO96_051654 [Rhipicephalus appendiculatus]